MLGDESQQILRALSRLKPNEHEILRLTVWEGLSRRESAQMLDITTNAAKKRFSRARRSLAREYNRMAPTRRVDRPPFRAGDRDDFHEHPGAGNRAV